MKSAFQTAAACTALLLLLGCGSEPPADIRIGGTIPDFSLKTLDGKTVNRADLAGKLVVLNFWATWCGPCMQEIPALKAIASQGKAEVIGIALDDGGEGPVGRFVAKNDLKYQILLGDEDTFRRFDGVGIPYTLVLDASTKIIAVYRSVAHQEDLERDLRGN